MEIQCTNSIAVLIFSGGFSSRMKSPKALLKLGNQTFLDYCTEKYDLGEIKDKYLILNRDLYYKKSKEKKYFEGLKKELTLVINFFPEKGRSYSIWRAVKCLDKYEACFFHNIDTPPPSKELINKMVTAIQKETDYVVPVIDGKVGHPVLLGKKIIADLSFRKSIDWNLKEVLKQYRRVAVDSNDKRLLMNLNTRKNWETFSKNELNLT